MLFESNTGVSIDICGKFRLGSYEIKQTPCPVVCKELYEPIRWSAKLVTILQVRGGRVGSLDQSRYYFIPVAPQLTSRAWVDPVPVPLLLSKTGNSGNRTRNLWICNKELWSLDYKDKSVK
jgi:hypothetical protein